MVHSRIGPAVGWSDLLVMFENGGARFITWEVYRDYEPIVTVGSKPCWAICVVDWQRLNLRAEHGSAMVAVRDLPGGVKPIDVEGEKEYETGQKRDEKEQTTNAVDAFVSLCFRPCCLG